MGWFWDKPAPKGESDPLRDLDPSLRDFLDKESPAGYKPAASPTPHNSQASATQDTNSQTPSTTKKVPKESLFQDGRYAYLWENYRPRAEIEEEAKTEQEKLSDIVGGYKLRKVQIAQAAIENCSFEMEDENHCYTHGTYLDRLTLCRTEAKIFERCFLTQSRFLKALGYLSAYDRPEEEDEAIQMHADTLYHRMLGQEKAIEAAKAAGEPIPSFAPILAPRTTKQQESFRSATINAAIASTKTSPQADAIQEPTNAQTPAEANRAAVVLAREKGVAAKDKDLPVLDPEVEAKLVPEAAKALRKRMKGMNAVDREIEQRSTLGEVESAVETGLQILEVRAEAQEQKKAARQERPEWAKFILKYFG